MAAGCWSVPQVVDLINRFKESPAQVMVDGNPLVSTFEGPDWAAHWPAVRCETGDICLIPDWSSLGPYGVGEKLDLIDGACKLTFFAGFVIVKLKGAVSWDAWPKAGQSKMTTVEDHIYKANLQGKKYMMGVSPWFFTGRFKPNARALPTPLTYQVQICLSGIRIGTAPANPSGMIAGSKSWRLCRTLSRLSLVCRPEASKLEPEPVRITILTSERE
jgi:hypothetical protein